MDRKSILDGGTDCGKGGTTMAAVHGLGGAVFSPAGPLAAQTTYGMTGPSWIGISYVAFLRVDLESTILSRQKNCIISDTVFKDISITMKF